METKWRNLFIAPVGGNEVVVELNRRTLNREETRESRQVEV